MKYHHILYCFLIILLTQVSVHAQSQLTLSKAIEVALKNNYNIAIARNETEIVSVQNNWQNTGAQPTVQAVVGNTLNSTFAESADATNENALNTTNNFNAGLEFSLTLFDGGRMFVRKDILEHNQALSELELQQKALSLTFSIVAAYFDIIRQKQQLQSINEVMDYNAERVAILSTSFNAGMSAKNDYLQAKIDYNKSLENAHSQKVAIIATKRQLQNLMGASMTSDFDVADSLDFDNSLTIDDLREKIVNVNMDIRARQKQLEITQLAFKEARRQYFPTLSVTGGYYFTNIATSMSNNASSHGPQIGGRLIIPIYQAGQNRQVAKIAKIQALSAEQQLAQTRLETLEELEQTFLEYETNKNLYEIERESYKCALENLEINQARFRLGHSTSLDVHIAQEVFMQSATRMVDFAYALKMSETKLKQLVAQ
ncbi:MAG: TolC family protein [Bacteroidales bacterium]|jgi:outer membrane protein TolC|nr:TolC family protein [Bacteroidales bacterium]